MGLRVINMNPRREIQTRNSVYLIFSIPRAYYICRPKKENDASNVDYFIAKYKHLLIDLMLFFWMSNNDIQPIMLFSFVCLMIVSNQ